MRVVVFGSGGMAKELIGYLMRDRHEVAYVVSTAPFNNPMFGEVVGELVLDDAPACLLAVADPAIKRAIVAAHPMANWDTYVHPSAFVSPHTTIGVGCVIGPQAIVAGDAVLEDFCFLNSNATIGHDSRLGAYSTLFPNSEVCGDSILGEGCLVGIGAYVLPGVTLAAGTKVSAGAIVRESVEQPCTIYGDPRGEHRVKFHS